MHAISSVDNSPMPSNPLADLRDVTICAVDSINPALAARALDLSLSQCRFGEAILFTHEVVETRARHVQIDPIGSLETYSRFMIKELVKYISTPWVLAVQWDGYVVDGSRWTDAFYQYDYIGARWPNSEEGSDVGNGGFSLRSSKLLRAIANDEFELCPDQGEDALICSTWRPALEEKYGIRFAPASAADLFAYEYAFPSRPTFGFHGVFNMWRHIEDNAMIEIIRTVDILTLTSPRGVALLKNYCDLRKFACVNAIYRRYRDRANAEGLVSAFVRNGVSEDVARYYVDLCEAS